MTQRVDLSRLGSSPRVARLARFGHYGWSFVRDREYRGRVLDLVQRQVGSVQPPEAVAAAQRDDAWLVGKRMYFVGGCELTHIKAHLESRGAVVFHTFDHQRASDPLAEVTDPDSPLWTFGADAVVFAQVQTATGLFHQLQWKGPALSARQHQDDLGQVVGSLANAIDLTRERVAAPIFLLGHPIGYRPAYGVLEQSVLRSSWSMAELIRRYDLALYEVAKARPSTYVVDVTLTLAEEGYGSGLYMAGELLGEHLTRSGGQRVAEVLYRMLYALDGNASKVKCAVFDLDNTLWSGVLREDGPGGVRVRRVELRAIKYLMRRGILVAVCSKNDPEIVDEVHELLGDDIFDGLASMMLNWDPKSENLKRMAKELNLGLDSFALFDDNEREHAEMTMNAPEVLLFRDSDILGALQLPEFEVGPSVTEEAQSRGQKYRQESERRAAQEAADEHDPDAFLRSLELRLELRPARASEVERVFELLGRTNQLNATLRRSALVDIEQAQAEQRVHVGHLADRFGDYGLIAAAVSSSDDHAVQLVDFALSCRAMGRKVEPAVLRYLGGRARASGRAALVVDFVRTDKNQQMRRALDDAGFQERSVVGDRSMLELDVVTTDVSVPTWLSVSEG